MFNCSYNDTASCNDILIFSELLTINDFGMDTGQPAIAATAATATGTCEVVNVSQQPCLSFPSAMRALDSRGAQVASSCAPYQHATATRHAR